MAKGMFALVELDDVVADSRHRASVDIEKDRIDMMAGADLPNGQDAERLLSLGY